jgi:SAM-dependent methyltransferase
MEARPVAGTSELYPADFFRRLDESEDGQFYAEPRLVVHIDERAIAAIGEFFSARLPQNGVILDLMTSWRSHLPDGFAKAKLVGLGLNAVEMSENPQLDEYMVHDLNANPSLPFEDSGFDAAVVTVSIQYMTRPIEVFREVNRVLKQGASFHVIYSNRMFPTKAVAVWQALDDLQRARLIASYFINSGGWEPPEALDISPKPGFYTDPVYVVTTRKKGT